MSRSIPVARFTTSSTCIKMDRFASGDHGNGSLPIIFVALRVGPWDGLMLKGWRGWVWPF